MTDVVGDGERRHFGGTYTRGLLNLLQDTIGADGLAEVLRLAGEQRPRQLLVDDAAWSSYEQCGGLLRAAAGLLGGPQALRAVGRGLHDVADYDHHPSIQAFGSPESLYQNAAVAITLVCPI